MFLSMAILIVALAVAVIIVVHGTLTKNDWGINTSAAFCPVCGIELPAHRRATNVRQSLWGGGSCAGCGAEVDKWGRLLDPAEISKWERYRRWRIEAALVAAILALNVWYDIYRPAAILYDVIGVLVLIVLFRRRRKSET